MIIAFLGCCGAVRENLCMLLAVSVNYDIIIFVLKYVFFQFMILLILCICFEIVAIVAASVSRDRLDNFVSNSLNETLHGSKDNKPYEAAYNSEAAWDFLQSEVSIDEKSLFLDKLFSAFLF